MFLQKGTLTLVGLAGKTLPSDLSLPLAILRAVRVRVNYVGSKRHVEQVLDLLRENKVHVQINLFGACSRNILPRLWMMCAIVYAVCLYDFFFVFDAVAISAIYSFTLKCVAILSLRVCEPKCMACGCLTCMY